MSKNMPNTIDQESPSPSEDDQENIQTEETLTEEELKRKENAAKWHKRLSFLESKWMAVFVLVLVATIVIGVFFMWRNGGAALENTLMQWGYLGAFVISALLNAVIILPAGNFLMIAMLGGALGMPWLVGLLGGLGAAIGESTGYLAGYSGQTFITKNKLYQKFSGWLGKHGFLFLFVLSVFPFMFDIAGLAAGVLKYPYKKFFLATFIGRSILYIVVAYAGALGWEWLLNLFD